ncbi:Portal protein [Trichinella spiralis]|uniref:Portal protein n=1 Tax=Trichinella spiralis TaxID=6334 RepID=A0ABR3K477_TRISP
MQLRFNLDACSTNTRPAREATDYGPLDVDYRKLNETNFKWETSLDGSSFGLYTGFTVISSKMCLKKLWVCVLLRRQTIMRLLQGAIVQKDVSQCGTKELSCSSACHNSADQPPVHGQQILTCLCAQILFECPPVCTEPMWSWPARVLNQK